MVNRMQPTSANQWVVNQWVVETPTRHLDVDFRGMGDLTFTVTNLGPAQRRVVLEIEPGPGADAAWFTTIDPDRMVSAGASVIYSVQVRVPGDVPAGGFDFTGRACSADHLDPADNWTSTDRITLRIPGRAAAGKPRFRVGFRRRSR
jgi:hypothetical protein